MVLMQLAEDSLVQSIITVKSTTSSEVQLLISIWDNNKSHNSAQMSTLLGNVLQKPISRWLMGT